MYDPPSGLDDMLSDADDVPMTSKFQSLDIDGVGAVQARKPQPRSAAALAASANSKASIEMKVDHLTLFVRHHLTDESYEDLLRGMVVGDYPPDTIQRVARAVSVWGTARPTVPSSR